MRKETLQAWAISVVVHVVLLLILLLTNLPIIQQRQEFVELSWGASLKTSEQEPVATAQSMPSATTETQNLRAVTPPAIPARKPSVNVQLPERRLPDLTQEVFLPRIEKEDIEDAFPSVTASSAMSSREPEVGRRANMVGEGEKTIPSVERNRSSGVSNSRGGDGSVDYVDRGVVFSVQWLQGDTRRKIAGNLPEYPPGVEVEAQIKIQAVVMPDGGVRVVGPLQKGNTKLEDAAIKELRFWRFEPLSPSQPQVEQPCVVIFRFTLK
jgi:hypothetical protein